MQIQVFDQSLHFPNDISAISECFEQINQLLAEANYVFSHLEVDDVPVYQDFYEYIAAHITRINSIEVKASTYKEMLDDTVLGLKDYTAGAIPEIQFLADQFYKTPDNDSWGKLTQLLEGLEWIMGGLDALQKGKGDVQPYQNAASYREISSELSEQFKHLESALSNQDLVLVGDLLRYEIAERLSVLDNELQTTIDNEVVRHDLS